MLTACEQVAPRRAAGLALVVVAVLAIWFGTRPARPLLPTDDLYTHLTVARHLARGEGFLCDVAYPLSFAFPFARRLPQPLVHRAPGTALLMTLPYLAGGGRPQRVIAAVRILQIVLLAVIVWLGGCNLLARGRPGAAAGWMLLLLANDLIGFAVDWGQSELPVALVFLWLWLRHRDGRAYPGWPDGLLLGALALLRPELLTVPVLWWWLGRRRGTPSLPRPGRRWLALLLVFSAVTGPWLVRNARLTGNPLFSLQAQAEHRKDTRGMPGYAVYRNLEPKPLPTDLFADPEPLLRKTVRGLRLHRDHLPRLIPWPLLALALAAALRYPVALWRRARWSVSAADREAAAPMAGGGPALAGATLFFLAVLYAPFDHSLRHLVVLVPVLAWEWVLFVSQRAARFLATREPDPGAAVPLRKRLAPEALSLVVTAMVVMLGTRQPVGWLGAAAEAERLQAGALAEAQALRAAPPGAAFVETSAAPWLADRPAVWSPADAEVRRRIAAWLAPSGRP